MTNASQQPDQDPTKELLFQPNDPAFFEDPHAVYRALRQQDPVHAVPNTNSWLLTRYEDVSFVLKDARFVKKIKRQDTPPPVEEDIRPAVELLNLFMLFRDPPDHTRLRSLVSKAFTPRMIDHLVPRIQSIAKDLLDDMEGHKHIELIAGYAFPLPVIVIAEMLGVPRQDRQKFKDWSNILARLIDYTSTRELLVEGSKVALEITEYLEAIIARRRKQPQDDLISTLIRAEEDGQKLTQEEIIASCVLLLVAGHETTVNLIANGVHLLLTHPDQLALLKQKPELLPGAVEEILRFESPVQMTSRLCSEDLTIGGKTLLRGQEVLTSLGGANRDPEIFEQPERFDIARKRNPHLAFAAGIHYCLGAALARAEGQVAIHALLQRFPGLSLTDAKPEWHPLVVFRSLQSLNVRLSS
ncbi:cytochrome P450 [Paenibacillus senegalensis]|uniref:cytochrome P450 n=1 Tax=Paenibacillus senegalensis TaxID=1465766 RepID=UPI0002893D66|nr:cytochrome P450 [Paenibacillus senegalensis]